MELKTPPAEEQRFIGVIKRGHVYQAQLRVEKRILYLPSCTSDTAAAKTRDRAVYKLKRTECGLNFPLTTEEKAELDAMSREEYLASLALEKEQGNWSRIRGKSKFMGVRRSGQRESPWSTVWSLETFDSEKAAAEAFDRLIVSKEGPSAMTNAKYFADPGTRERAWEERRHALIQKEHEKNKQKDLSSRSFKGVKRAPGGWIAELRINRLRLQSTRYSTPEEAAACFDKLSYCLHSTADACLNFSLSEEQKAELDGRSAAENIAALLVVDRERRMWDRNEAKFEARGLSSRYRGVCYLKRKKRWRATHGYKVMDFRSEIEAADWYDSKVVEKQGSTAMTNAKYWGTVGDAVAWKGHLKEREQDIARWIQKRMERTGETAEKAQLAKLSLRGIGDVEALPEELRLDTSEGQNPHRSRLPALFPTAESPTSASSALTSHDDDHGSPTPKFLLRAASPTRSTPPASQDSRPLHTGTVPPQLLSSPLAGSRDSGARSLTTWLHPDQGAAGTPSALQGAALAPLLQPAAGVRVLSGGRNSRSVAGEGSGEPLKPWAGALWPAHGSPPHRKILPVGRGLGHVHAGWLPWKAMRAHSSAWSQAATRSVLVGAAALARGGKLTRLALPLTGGLSSLLALKQHQK